MKSSLEDEILDDLGKQISEEIDFEVMSGMLITFGWTKVDMFYYAMSEVDEWLKTNCQADYARHREHFLFEDEQDANWFKLRWL
jgi:hypothetical protein